MIINMSVSLTFYNKFKKPMPRKKFQHMIQKRDGRGNFTSFSIIQTDFKLYVGFFCFPDDFCSSNHNHLFTKLLYLKDTLLYLGLLLPKARGLTPSRPWHLQWILRQNLFEKTA